MPDKEWLTVDEQIELLKQRGLYTTNDYDFIEEYLEEFGYYEIINGYREPFVAEGTPDTFKPNTQFKDIAMLFMYDQNLRDATMSTIEMFELSLRQSVARAFGTAHGENQQEYLNMQNYRAPKNPHTLQNLVKNLAELAYANNDQPFEHYRNTYGNVPPWIAVKGLEFWALKTWYSLLERDQKILVINDMLSDKFLKEHSEKKALEFFGNALQLVHQMRNRVAHAGRIYNYFPTDAKTNKPFIKYDSSFHQSIKVTPALWRQGIGTGGLWIMMHFFGMLRSNRAFYSLSKAFSDLTHEYVSTYPDIYEFLLKEMRIPSNDDQMNEIYFLVLIESLNGQTIDNFMTISTSIKDQLFFYSNRILISKYKQKNWIQFPKITINK